MLEVAANNAKSGEFIAATNALMATLSSTFGRVAVTMRETSAKLATTSERIKNAVPARRTV